MKSATQECTSVRHIVRAVCYLTKLFNCSDDTAFWSIGGMLQGKNLKSVSKNRYQRHSVRIKYHINWLDIEP